MVSIGETHGDRPDRVATSVTIAVLCVAAAKLLLHLLTAARYGVFRDEMYYLACARHLAWGYVDQPPAIALIGWFARHLFGESPLAIRLLPAIAGATLVWMTARLAHEMGGGGFAQVLSALAILPVPIYLILDHWLTMNAFEPLIWMGCLWCVLSAINRNNPRLWFWFGLLAGVGFETKYSIAFLLLGVLLGLMLTSERRFLRSGWLWLGMLVCGVIALPNFLWQLHNDFPFLQLMHNIRMGHRDIVRAPVAFIADQASIMNPILAPLWLGGVIWLLFSKAGRRYRMVGWTFLAVLAAFIALKGKNYYVAPIYPVLFAAGGVGFEQITRTRFRWSRTAYVAVVIVVGALLMPMVCPVLSPENFLRYEAALHLSPLQAERQNNGPLPQYFADEFGWREMVEKVAQVYNSLPPDQRAHAAIFCNDWGEAAAVDFYGPHYGLPPAISKHNNYWIWGPRAYTGDIMIVLGSDGQDDRAHFASVEPAAVVGTEYSRRDEHFTIWLCRGLKWNIRDVWPQLKQFD